MDLYHLHDVYDVYCEQCEIQLSFQEFALLYLLQAGISMVEVATYLFVSQATLSRCRQRLQKKLRAKTFEQALLRVSTLKLMEATT